MFKIAAITPASRGVKDLDHLLRDFRNQTLPRQYWMHVVVWDGKVPDDVKDFMEKHKNDYNLKFTNIEKDPGDMRIAPGTRPRNHGVLQADSEYIVFCDDDDRYKSTYLESMCTNLQGDTINVLQMSCQESRMFRDGDPTRIRLIPEVGLPDFPIICHVGTPCFCVKKSWAIQDPWQHEPEHDYRFIKRIVDKYNPTIQIIPGMAVDVDSKVIGNMKDWVSIPPFYRGD